MKEIVCAIFSQISGAQNCCATYAVRSAQLDHSTDLKKKTGSSIYRTDLKKKTGSSILLFARKPAKFSRRHIGEAKVHSRLLAEAANKQWTVDEESNFCAFGCTNRL